MKLELPETNEWQELICVKKGENIYHKIKHTNLGTLKVEFLHVPSGKIRAKNSSVWHSEDYDDFHWDSYFDYDAKKPKSVIYPVRDIRWRFEDKKFQKMKQAIELLEIGDFVKFQGTRSGIWNKVESVKNYRAFGQKYRRPEEGSGVYHSSDNCLFKIQKIVRDGKQIFPVEKKK